MSPAVIATLIGIGAVNLGVVIKAAWMLGSKLATLDTNMARLTPLPERVASLETAFEAHATEDTKNFDRLDADLRALTNH